MNQTPDNQMPNHAGGEQFLNNYDTIKKCQNLFQHHWNNLATILYLYTSFPNNDENNNKKKEAIIKAVGYLQKIVLEMHRIDDSGRVSYSMLEIIESIKTSSIKNSDKPLDFSKKEDIDKITDLVNKMLKL